MSGISRRIADARSRIPGLLRVATASTLLLAGGHVRAQAGVYANVFGGGIPTSAPSRPTEADRDIVPEEIVKRPPRPGGKLAVPGAVSTRPEPLTRDDQEALDRRLSPPAGTSLAYTNVPNPRLGQRQGQSVVQKDASGTRLGGGYDYPSPEAVTYDPRDLLEARRNDLSDPRSP